MRTTLKSQFDNPKAVQARIIARNTFQYQRGDDIVIRLHQTDIVVKHLNGSVTLNSGGWKTVTTKDRMHQHLPAGYSLWQAKGQWHISTRNWNDPDHIIVPYFDGMNVPRDVVKPPAKAAKVEKQDKAMRKAVQEFVCAGIPLEGKLPEPGNGDCWYCLMFDKPQSNTGAHPEREPAKPTDNAHILSHIKEGYCHGSLIFNALTWAGYRQPEIFWHFGPRDSVRRALERYLYRRLGLVS